MAHADQQSDPREPGESTSDHIQARAAETVNNSPSAAIPIPTRLVDDEADDEDDSDIERGADVSSPLIVGSQQGQAPRLAWRNLLPGSLSALSGETLRQPSPADRTR
jgi:hypothetical protein